MILEKSVLHDQSGELKCTIKVFTNRSGDCDWVCWFTPLWLSVLIEIVDAKLKSVVDHRIKCLVYSKDESKKALGVAPAAEIPFNKVSTI